MEPKRRLDEIHSLIAADIDTMQHGGDPGLDATALAGLLDEATRLTLTASNERITLTPDEQAAAAAVVPLWQGGLARMGLAEQLQEVRVRRADRDRVALGLIAWLSPHPEVRAAASGPLDTFRGELFEVRGAGAKWRELARLDQRERAVRAELRQKIEDARNAPPPAPAPDRAAVYGPDYGVRVL